MDKKAGGLFSPNPSEKATDKAIKAKGYDQPVTPDRLQRERQKRMRDEMLSMATPPAAQPAPAPTRPRQPAGNGSVAKATPPPQASPATTNPTDPENKTAADSANVGPITIDPSYYMAGYLHRPGLVKAAQGLQDGQIVFNDRAYMLGYSASEVFALRKRAEDDKEGDTSDETADNSEDKKAAPTSNARQMATDAGIGAGVGGAAGALLTGKGNDPATANKRRLRNMLLGMLGGAGAGILARPAIGAAQGALALRSPAAAPSVAQSGGVAAGQKPLAY